MFAPLDQQKAMALSPFKRRLVNAYILECRQYFFRIRRNQEDTALPEDLIKFASVTASEQKPFGINEKIKQKMNVIVQQDDSDDQSQNDSEAETSTSFSAMSRSQSSVTVRKSSEVNSELSESLEDDTLSMFSASSKQSRMSQKTEMTSASKVSRQSRLSQVSLSSLGAKFDFTLVNTKDSEQSVYKNVLTSVQSSIPIDVVALEKSVHGHLFNRHRRTVIVG